MKNTFTSLALATVALLASAPAAASIVLAFTPTATHINVGEQVTIKVSINNLGSEILSGFDLNFLYNPTVLSLTGFTYFQTALGLQTPLNATTDPGNAGFDVVSIDDETTLAANQPDSFDLFSFVMNGLGDGVSNFTLGTDVDFERLFAGLTPNTLAVDVGSACISVGAGVCSTAIPEPGTAGLAGLAVLGAVLPAALSRRRKI